MELKPDDANLRILMMSTTLRGTYDEWIINSHFAEVLDVTKNETCLSLKNIYPEIDNKVAQCMTLASLLYIYIIFCGIQSYDSHNLNNSSCVDLD